VVAPVTRRIIRSLCVAGSLAAPVLTNDVTHGSSSVAALVDAGPLAQELPVEETYRRQCAACHGEKGRGDGRSARRYNPRPPDFQDPGGVVLLNDDQLLEVISGGRGAMPSFREVLSREAIAAIVAYVRVLSGQSEPPPGAADPGSARDR